MSRPAAIAPRAATVALVWAVLAGAAQAADTPLADVHVVYHFNAIGAGIAELTVDLKLAEESYTASASGRTTGLVDALTRVRISGSTSGAVADALPRPARHTYTYSERGNSRTVTLQYGEDGTPAINAVPPFKPSFAKVPVPPERTTGTIDPVSPFVVPASPGAGHLDPAHCGHEFSVFTGELLLGAKLSHISSEQNARVRGTIYEGPVMHCSIAVTALGGHKEGDYLSRLATRPAPEVWMAPIVDGRYYLPVKVTVPTPFGSSELVARSITVNPAPSRAALGQ